MIPGTGRRRDKAHALGAVPVDAPTLVLPWAPQPAVSGEVIGLVRPYLVAHEQQQEAQRQRRRAGLVISTGGVSFVGEGGAQW
jgi:hypothetical protein